MKKTYEKPVLVRKQKLSSVTAGPGPSNVVLIPVE
ncbi:conserved hypothetical protein [Mesorhizobium sp. ORS 3359]|nr:conserved hypothetical protein [Mesorhizobium sp. ORS 3359]